MYDIYQDILQKKPEDYLPLLDLIINARCINDYKQCAVMRDRGGEVDYIQTYSYDIAKVTDIVNKNLEDDKWFPSLYLSWVLYETDATFANLRTSFDLFCYFTENNLYRRIIETNRYECYGFCMTALTLLDKVFLLNYKSIIEKEHVLLKIAIEGIVSYIYYHKGANTLWDAEMFSSYARLFDRFRDYMTMILMENQLGSYAQYSYCYGMFEACESCPVECEYKTEYYRNALMMQQNQTVVGVTNDAMDASFMKAVALGEEQFSGFTIKMLKYNITNESELNEMTQFVDNLNSAYTNRISAQNGFDRIKCLERFFQIEPYDKYGYKRPPYKRTTINYKKLLSEINVDERTCTRVNKDDNEVLLSTDILNLYPDFHQNHDYNKIKDSCINYLRITVRADESMKSISVLGINLYELYLDISRTGLFFNIPCVVGVWDVQYSGSIQHILLLVGTNYDASNGFKD